MSEVKKVVQREQGVLQPKIKTKSAKDLLKRNKGMIGSKITKSTKTIKGINPRTRSRIGKGDTKVEDLSTIVDVKLPKEPAILRKTPSSFVSRRMTLGAFGKKKK